MSDTKNLTRTLRKATLLCKHINNPENGLVKKGIFVDKDGSESTCEIFTSDYVLYLSSNVPEIIWTIHFLAKHGQDTENQDESCHYLLEVIENAQEVLEYYLQDETAKATEAKPILKRYLTIVDELTKQYSVLLAQKAVYFPNR